MSGADGERNAAEDAVAEPWQPLSTVDFSILALIGTLQAVALLICVHLMWWRKWPPYVTKNPVLVVIATVSGVLWTLAMVVSSGFIEREEGDILAACGFERFLVWSTLCVHTVAFFIRVYRMWRILIKHDSNMWRTEHQVLFMSSVSLIPVVVTWIAPRSGHFDEDANSCSTNALSAFVVLGMDILGFLAICFLWFVCARQLKSVRKQFNEYSTMKRTLLCMTITLASYAVVVLFILADNYVVQRRVSVFYPLATTYILLWGSIREPFLMKMVGDEEYLWSYTKGFSELPSPAQLKASLAEQLSVDELREEFRRYIKTRVAQELVDFYLDSLDREEVTGFFERQAITMRIVEQYIREGAPDQVNISGECREKILRTDVTAYDIFDDARREVLDVLETNFRRDFVTTQGFQRIVDASEQEQRELRMLRAGGILPCGTPSTPSPAAEKPPAPASPLAANRASPRSPPLREGFADTFKKFPLFARIAKAMPETHRRRRMGGRVGGACKGGSARVSAGSVEPEEGGENREAVIESVPALARTLQNEKARRGAQSETGGVTAAGDIEVGERGAEAARSGSAVAFEVHASALGDGSIPGGDGDAVSDGTVTIHIGKSTDDCVEGRNCVKDDDINENLLDVAVPHQPSSSMLSVSPSASGPHSRDLSSDNPSTDSLRGVHFASCPDQCCSQHDGSMQSGSIGGGGSSQKERQHTPGVGPPAREDRADRRQASCEEVGSLSERRIEVAAGAGMIHNCQDWLFQELDSDTSGKGLGGFVDAREGSKSSNSSPAGLSRLQHGAFSTTERNITLRQNQSGAAAVGGQPEIGNAGGNDSAAMAVEGRTKGDRVPREHGLACMAGLSPVSAPGTSDWVKFSDWLESKTGQAAKEGVLTAIQVGGGQEGAGKILVGDQEWFSTGSAGYGGGGGGSGSWYSGRSSWSNIQDASSESENVLAPRTPPAGGGL